jgi:hypothetical protein
MKKINALKLFSLSAVSVLGINSSYALSDDSGFYTGLRFGLYETYEKKAIRNSKNLNGDFNANTYGLVAGYRNKNWRYFINYNPEADADLKNEIAKIESTLLGVDYNVWQKNNHNLLLGGFAAYNSFELEKGPGGIAFKENPTADGATFGVLAEYQYKLNQNWSVGGGLKIALAEFDGDGEGLPNGDPVDIKISSYQQIDFNIAYQF